MHTYIHVCIHACIHTHTYTHAYTHIHTCILAPSQFTFQMRTPPDISGEREGGRESAREIREREKKNLQGQTTGSEFVRVAPDS